MDSPERTANPQTEKLILWSCFLLLCTVVGLVYSTYQDEEERLETMRMNEKQKKPLSMRSSVSVIRPRVTSIVLPATLNSSAIRPANASVSLSLVRS